MKYQKPDTLSESCLGLEICTFLDGIKMVPAHSLTADTTSILVIIPGSSLIFNQKSMWNLCQPKFAPKSGGTNINYGILLVIVLITMMMMSEDRTLKVQMYQSKMIQLKANIDFETRMFGTFSQLCWPRWWVEAMSDPGCILGCQRVEQPNLGQTALKYQIDGWSGLACLRFWLRSTDGFQQSDTPTCLAGIWVRSLHPVSVWPTTSTLL